MKITLQRGDLLCHPDSVFVKVTPPATATLSTQPQEAYVSDWAGVAHEILTDTPIAPEPEPCQAKLCLNSTKAALTAESRHCQKRAGCILRKDEWNEKDRQWLEIVGDVSCLAIGSVLAWASYIVLGVC